MRPTLLLAALAALAGSALSKTVSYDWTVGWVTANPDGVYDRPTIGINGAWPLPLVSADVGDEIVINLHNDLKDTSTSLHFHGLFQNGTNLMDGAVGVTQCAIPPGNSFTYRFTVRQPGTYWYHAHNDGTYPEGLRGPVVIHDPSGPYEGKGVYDEELIITFSDWYHHPIRELIAEFLHYKNPTGAEPVPQAALMNDTQDLQVKVQPGKTYLVRMVNMAAFAGMHVWFEDHKIRVVEVDGVWTDEAETDVLYLSAAQRYSVLLTTKADASSNFPIAAAMDVSLFDVIPDNLNPSVTGWLVYDDSKQRPQALARQTQPLDDFDLVPHDKQKVFEKADRTIRFDVKMSNLGDGANYAFLNDITYVAPKVPSLYTALSVGGVINTTNHIVYGSHTNAHVLLHNEIVEIIVNNFDDGDHPFHVHGHQFQVVHRSGADAGPFDPASASAANIIIRSDSSSKPRTPMRRDTITVRGNGHAVLRFRADNPGIWLFHCHIEWHMEQGLIATLVEAPDVLTESSSINSIPMDHLDACRAACLPFKGNAAGNIEDVLDLTGENGPPRPLPAGFTAKGYVAFGFSCLAAFMGLASIYYYGNLPGPSQKTSDHVE